MSGVTSNITQKTTKPSEKLEEVNKNCANIKRDKNAPNLEVSLKEIINKNSSSDGTSSTKAVTNSWASSYLQSIGHGTRPIKLNLSLSRNKTSQSTESTSIKCKGTETKTPNVKANVKLPLPPTPQPTNAGFRPRMDTKTWLTQAFLRNTSENEKKAAATTKPDSISQSEPNIISTDLNSCPITNSSAPRIHTETQLNKQPDTKVINRPSESINTNNVAENIQPQINQDSHNNLAFHSTHYANFTPRMETLTGQAAHANTFGPHIQSYYNNLGFHSTPYANYTPHMHTATWSTQASHSNFIQNSYEYINNNNLPKHLLRDHITPHGNFTYHTDTGTWHTHFSYTNTIHSHNEELNTLTEHDKSYSNNTSYTTPYSSFAPHIDTLTCFNQAPQEKSIYSPYRDINSSNLTKHSLSEHDRTYSNLSHTTSDTSVRPRNDIVIWLTQLMSGKDSSCNTKSNISTNKSPQRILESSEFHAELSANEKFLTHSDEKSTTYDTNKNASKQQEVNTPPSNKNVVTHSVSSKTSKDKEKRVKESLKRDKHVKDLGKSTKFSPKKKRSGSTTKDNLILKSKSKIKDTEVVCVKNCIDSEKTIIKRNLEKETAILEARLKAVNLKIMKLMSKTGSSSKPGSTSTILNSVKDKNKSRNKSEFNKDADTKSKESSEISLPTNKDKCNLKKKGQSDKIEKEKTLKRKSRTAEHTKTKRRRTLKAENEISSKKLTRSSSCESPESQNCRRIAERGGFINQEKNTKTQCIDTKGMKRHKTISSENEVQSPPKKRIRRDSSQSLELKQNIRTCEQSSEKAHKKDYKMKEKGLVKSVIKLPEKSPLKHPRIIAPESDSSDYGCECDFDLRSRLSKRNYELLSKNIPYKQPKEKIETPRENLVITINREDDEETNNKLPMPEPSQPKPKIKKYKKIQLIIKVLCQDHEGSSENSSDDEKPNDHNSAQNVDSFLDDFNVDEIVNSLKHSPKCDTKDQDNLNISQQIMCVKDKEIKNKSDNTTKSFVQPKQIKTEIMDEDIQSYSLNNCEMSQENVYKNTPDVIELTELSTSKEPEVIYNKTNHFQEASIKVNKEVTVDMIKIKKEIDTDVLENNEIKCLPSLNDNVDQIFEPAIGNNKLEASIEVNEKVDVVDLINIKKEKDVSEDNVIKCVPSLNNNVDQNVKPSIGLKLDHKIQIRTEFHTDDTKMMKTKNNLEASIKVNEKDAVENLVEVKKEHDIDDIINKPYLHDNVDQTAKSSIGPILDQSIKIGTEFQPVELENELVGLCENDNNIKANHENEIKVLCDGNSLGNVDKSLTNSGAQSIELSNSSEVPVPEILTETNCFDKNSKEENNNETENSRNLKTDVSKAETIKMENQQEFYEDHSVTSITGSAENNMESKGTSTSSNAEKRTVKIVPLKADRVATAENKNTSEDKKAETRTVKIMSQAEKTLANKFEKWVLEYLHKDITVISMIHQGRFSKIYKTMDTRGKYNAVKILTNINQRRIHYLGIEKTTMFKDIQKDVPKENLNTVYFINGFSLEKNWCFFMEYYPTNLRDALNTKMFHIDQVQNLARQLVSAVVMLRHNNIVHSDINPRHILIDASNHRLKLAGFDSAYYSGTRPVLPNIGTVRYRAPEIILGYSASFSIDVWSTAVVIYQMATGAKLFNGLYNNDILYLQMCTLGALPHDMIQYSAFAYKHFSGTTFMRRSGDHGKVITYIRQVYSTRSLGKFLFSSYNKGWRGSRTVPQRTQDVSKLNLMLDLLNQMLVLDPRRRVPIEFAYAHRFIYEMLN